MDVVIRPYNEEAYKKVMEKFKTDNIAAVVHPSLSSINEIGVKFIAQGTGKTICVESDSRMIYGGIKIPIDKVVDNDKRKAEIEYVRYSELLRMIKEEKDISGYDNILLLDLDNCNEKMWQEGIDRLLGENKDAKTLELVDFSTFSRNENVETFKRVRSHIASFISEEKGTKMGICAPIYVNEMECTDEELKKLKRRVNKLDNKDLKEELLQKISIAKNLNKEMRKIFPKPEGDLEDIWEEFNNSNNDESDRLTEEEFQENVRQDLNILELRNNIRRYIREIKEGLGDKVQKSELESIKEEYEGLSAKEQEAESLLEKTEEMERSKDDESR